MRSTSRDNSPGDEASNARLRVCLRNPTAARQPTQRRSSPTHSTEINTRCADQADTARNQRAGPADWPEWSLMSREGVSRAGRSARMARGCAVSCERGFELPDRRGWCEDHSLTVARERACPGPSRDSQLSAAGVLEVQEDQVAQVGRAVIDRARRDRLGAVQCSRDRPRCESYRPRERTVVVPAREQACGPTGYEGGDRAAAARQGHRGWVHNPAGAPPRGRADAEQTRRRPTHGGRRGITLPRDVTR
jgi:hypothetical protein